MRGPVALFAGALIVAVLAAAPQASARSYEQSYQVTDPYCAQKRQNRMLLGAAIGATAGAVLGNNVASRNAQTEGAVLGGVAGGAAGAAIGRGTVRCETQRTTDSYGYSNRAQPQPSGYGRTVGYDQYGAVQLPPRGQDTYRNDNWGNSRQDCRWGEQVLRDPEGREIRENVYMCRGQDGIWRRQG